LGLFVGLIVEILNLANAQEVDYEAVLNVASATIETAQEGKARGSSLDPGNSVRINYAYVGWNRAAIKFDSGSLIMREGNTGRLIQVHLEETEPDSARFSGLYSISFQSIEKLKVEFYVPSQALLETVDGMKSIGSMIASGKLARRPFILRRTPTGSQNIEIFDTREQAQMAMRALRAEQQVQGLQNKKFPSDQQLDMARITAEMQVKAALAAAAVERIRQEQLETQKLAEALAKQAALSKAEQERREKEAAVLATNALKQFKEEKFKESSENFGKAVDLDPDNHSYYFQYGVALYKIEFFNKALSFLRIADGPDVNQVERDFFVALCHFRIKEFDSAVTAFDKVIAAKQPETSSAALFYKGVVRFEQKNWDEAREAFQTVLDTSSDTQLDQRAENYIEQILRIQMFETERKRKWQFSTTFGGQYDSNVTLASDSTLSQGSQTKVDGFRSLVMGSGRYRPVYDETREFAAQLDVLYMYTLDSGFQYLQTLRNADPLVATLTLPWTRKGLLFGKGHKLDVTPGYESITMSVEDNTSKEIISSYLLNITNLFVMNDKLFSNYNLELRSDQNKLASQNGDNDSSATKVKLLNSNLHFLGDKRLEIVTSEVALTLNQAVGKNAVYNRLDLAVGYIQPFYWETSGTVKLGYYYLNYPLKSNNRIDHSYTITAGISKKLNDTFSTGFVGTYNIVNSTDNSYTLKKWTAMVTLSALTAF
jgi:tetratricopeptide (TPR) repeat protein